jgi:hypothetical protein
MIENGNEIFVIHIDSELSPTTGMCSYCFENSVLWRLLAIFDLAANFSGLARAALLWVSSDRNPSFKVDVDHGLANEGCKLKMFLVRLFISSKFSI